MHRYLLRKPENIKSSYVIKDSHTEYVCKVVIHIVHSN